MSENFIGPPKRDFDQLFRLAETELITMRNNSIDPALLVAICVNASQGNGFFCCNPANYRAAMQELSMRTTYDAKEFLGKITPVSGFRKGQTPKFKFAIKNWAAGEREAWLFKGTMTDGVIFACNWGVAQMPAFRVVDCVEPDFKLRYLQAFLGDLNMQMRELIRVLDIYKRTYLKCDATMLLGFHEQRQINRPLDELIERDLDLANRLRNCGNPISAGYKV